MLPTARAERIHEGNSPGSENILPINPAPIGGFRDGEEVRLMHKR